MVVGANRVTFGNLPFNVLNKFKEQAKEISKGEIEHSFIFGRYSITSISFEEYYNERFKNNLKK